MAPKATQLTAPNGSTVSVDPDKADRLLRQGYRKKKPSRAPRTAAASDDSGEK